ncbi:hypothetical protein K466DRAFT_486400 [Polyporus arcularius HHB13444]|uniref:R3H domain-containing protein n=1 Tax=Polyporus arcularius HHB13444 TaxID=1314778 RepID=A0A5C3PJF7_9APHY|nr:hypothetical protein K466DRAFT_486400 [Polyporus arcularius HHB13444]
MADTAAAIPAANTSDDARRHRGPPRTHDGTRSQDQGTRASGGSGLEVSGRAEGASRPRRPRAPKPKEGHAGEHPSAHSDGAASASGGRPGGRRGNRRRPGAGGDPPGAGSAHRPQRPRKPRAPQDGPPSNEVSTSAHTPARQDSSATADASAAQKRPRRNRGRKFGGELTGGDAPAEPAQDVSSADKYKNTGLKPDDLTSRLIAELSTPPYPDCLICFAPITPMQQTWSCSPSNPTLAATDDESGIPVQAQRADANAQCCWMTFHIKCIRSWASKSVKDVEEAWRMRGETRQGDWRCPGCQSKRTAIPSSYWCFCGSTPDPKPPRLATPHSCANPCSRPRGCGHPCSLNCHPGPCPPCQVTTSQPCYCGKHVMSFRCSHRYGRPAVAASAELSCGESCGRMLSCGNHTCQDVCHPGKCSPCPIREKARCYCGKEEKELGCGEGEPKECVVYQNEAMDQWVGRFACEQTCERPFDCGIHHCKKSCHPPSLTPPPCPNSPSLVTHCPCGKHPLVPDSAPFFPPGTLLTRVSCTDIIPTCQSTCMKPLDGCEHVCSAKCHTGPCPPCSIMLVRPCRCGATTTQIRCSEDQARARARARGESGPDTEILCERPCGALRACGRHQCTRLCCPMASLAGLAKGKGKKRAGADVALVDQAGVHECDLVCGKPLSCGNHYCEERDHRGACPPCLRSSFEEMVCHCGRTVLDPPIPCGTRIACGYPCSRPPPPCGHPKTQHACHEDPIRCPPCPFLTSKQCACGKKMVDNVRCSQEKVSCGTTCGKLLSCGFHHCERLCHGDACGACHATCGKPRKLCLPALHPCTLPCHAPASCDESDPCRSIVTITCSCGRLRQSVSCGRSASNPAGREGSQQLKCSNECAIAKRNARLAEALGINPDRDRVQQVTYNDELLGFARANTKFCGIVEKSFSDFLSSDKKSQILPHMPEQKRKFVHDLAAIYRMDTQLVDQEPHRSVQLIRRIDSRVPNPTLSAAIGQGSSGGLGKLADLRSPGPGLQPLSRPASSRASPAPASQAVAGSSTGRGWTSVVARPPQSASPAPSSWGSAPERAKTPVRSVPSPAPVRTAPLPAPAPLPPTQVLSPQDVPDDWEDAA